MLHLEMDEWKGDLCLPTENKEIYSCPRMLPPGNHRYFFTYGGKQVIAEDQKQTSDQPPEKKKAKIYLNMDKFMTEKQKEQEVERLKAEESKRKKAAGPMTHEEKMEAKIAAIKKAKMEAEAHVEDDEINFLEIDIPFTNLITNIERTKMTYTANYQS